MARVLAREREQPLVRDRDQRVDHAGAAPRGPARRGARAACPSKRKGLVTTPTVSAPALARDLRDDGRRAGAGAAAHAGGDEDHVGAREQLLDALLVLERGLAARSRDWRRRRGRAVDVGARAGACTAPRLCSSACASVLAAMNSTPSRPELIIVLTALPPPPPTPMTLIEARIRGEPSKAIISPPSVSIASSGSRTGPRAPLPGS